MRRRGESPIDEQQAVNDAACNGTAILNGFNIEQAEHCDDGNLNCVKCPFRPREIESEADQWARLTRRTNNKKLTWLKSKLQEEKIPHRINGESFYGPILEVRYGDLQRASDILEPVDDIPDDDPQFNCDEITSRIILENILGELIRVDPLD